MDIGETLARYVFVPLYELRDGRRPARQLRRLLKTQYASPEEIRRLQWDKLRSVVGHAARVSPFYRQRFAEAGVDAADLRNWDDFHALPLLTKDDVRGNMDAMIAEDVVKGDLHHKRTGGSTGVPLHLYWTNDARRFKYALGRRHAAWAGTLRGMRQAALWGDTEKSLSFRQRVRRVLAERTLYLDTLLMDDEHIDRFVQQLRKYRPPCLTGHGHSLYFFARAIEDRGIEDLRFESIISTAEVLTDEERKVVERVFGSPVFDRYGCEEVSIIASECEVHDGLHIAAEGLVVEVLDETSSGPGRVVITDLVNYGMPFIRYEIGDLATTREGPCACGRGLPRLGRISGRTSDFLVTPEGRSVSGISILDTFMIHVRGIKQSQIVQEAVDELRILVVKDERFGDETRQELDGVVREVFGPKMRWSVETVDEIPRTARGKYQFTISKIPAAGATPEREGR